MNAVNTHLLRVSLRMQAIYLPGSDADVTIHPTTLHMVHQLEQLGYAVTEPLLHALNALTPTQQVTVLQTIGEVMGTDLNWAPLVKGWKTPTGETIADHLVTLVANLWGEEARFHGTRLPCGHLIPDGTFPLERYNGCPFCGMPFELARSTQRGQGSKKRLLELWREQNVDHYLASLLASRVPLDATQRDSLGILLAQRPLPQDVPIAMKETRMMVIDALIAAGHEDRAQAMLATPADVLRFLWYRHTGHTQVLQPRVLIDNAGRAGTHHWLPADRAVVMREEMRTKLRLHYNRAWCRRVARWLNEMPMSVEAMCETMHPRRAMWVRFIRALRLPELARRHDHEQLRRLLEAFYRSDYRVWQGEVEQAKLRRDVNGTLALLKQRPGIFARSLFSTMLWFGPAEPLRAFEELLPQFPARLLYTLSTAAHDYFDHSNPVRVVRLPSGQVIEAPAPRLLKLYSDDDLAAMARDVEQLYYHAMTTRFAAMSPQAGGTIYIDPQLHHIPLAVGDRATTVLDVDSALQGTQFAVEGSQVRLFLQWGNGLPAQHLDMDLSCSIVFDELREPEQCAFFSLTATGAKHSGDIRSIPDEVGTAEYIELDLDELRAAGATMVAFACNAYSAGNLSPRLVVGWMNSSHPMTVDEATGVAYDPSTVQHMVRVGDDNLAKGLVFGVLEVPQGIITWLEMPFTGQTVRALNFATLRSLMARLRAKPTIGRLLTLKAQAQGLTPVNTPDEATEAYTYRWAQDAAAVATLLLPD